MKLDRAQFLPSAILKGKESYKPIPRSPTPPPEPLADGEELWGKTPPPPEPTLPGEETGEWLCANGLLNKRLDVVLQGIATYDNRVIRNSPKWLAMEGKTCILVQANAGKNRKVERDQLKKKKVKVYQVGSTTANPEDVPPETIRPRRTLADGRSISVVTQRVVIIGSSVHGPLETNIGRYAETRPNPDNTELYGGPNYVWVQVEGGDMHLYHVSSLCLSVNEAILESSASVF